MTVRSAVLWTLVATIGVVFMAVWFTYSIFLGIRISEIVGGGWTTLYAIGVLAIDVFVITLFIKGLGHIADGIYSE